MNRLLHLLSLPIAVSITTLLAFWWGFGLSAFFTVALLAVLEITLSFDNAVVNAKILRTMSKVWQQRFLTWGIFVAVVLTRAVLPILIVALSSHTSPVTIAQLAFFEPATYAEYLERARYIIGAFGSTFLLMVGMRYFFDTEKTVHWFRVVERKMRSWGGIEAIEAAISLTSTAIVAYYIPEHSAEILFAGIVAVVLFIIVHGVAGSLEHDAEAGLDGPAKNGLWLFVYLNIIDAAFSLDSVVGAFALSMQLPIIIAGLGIGAYFVRTLTIYMVEEDTLSKLMYVEHGAHWAIVALAAAMITNLFTHVPEIFTGLLGAAFVGTAYISSIRARGAM